jgi:uncharacterized protein YcfL
MKKVAIVTAAVCALALGACSKKEEANTAANETAVENTASTDVNVAANDVTANADAALNADVTAIDNSTANDVANATENK